MTSAAACPDDEPFLRLMEGRLPGAEREQLMAHVHVCSRCSLLLTTPEQVASRARSLGGGVLVASFRSGDVLAGRYRLERMVGAGGMGEVYEAIDLSLNEPLALKVVRATVADDMRAVSRLKSEVLLARRVTHPNVCRIFDFGVHRADGTDEPPLPFLTMELLAGLTLQARLRQHGQLDVSDALNVSQQLAEGLWAAHRVHVIHKDLKAENVILIESPGTGLRAVITDFGLASTLAAVDDGAAAGSGFSGTPGYVAPERLIGAPATEANDVYALGVVMQDMLTGTLPDDRTPGRVARPSSPDAEPLFALSRRCRATAPDGRPSLDEVRLALAKLRRPHRSGIARVARWGLAALAAAALVATVRVVSSPAERVSVPPRTPAAPAGNPASNVVLSPPAEVPLLRAPDPPAKRVPAGRRGPRRRTPPVSAGSAETRLSGTSSTERTLLEAEALLGSGQIAAACARAQLAAERDPQSFDVWAFLGRCTMRLPDPESARTYFRKALEVAPDNRRAPLIRALVGEETP
jgi:serine/threonine protein kinase